MSDPGVTRSQRWGAVAVMATALLAAGCSSSSSGSSPKAGATPTPTSGPAAIALARTAMKSVKDYAFRLTVQQTGAHPTNLLASGVVQNPSRLQGSFIVNGQTIRVLAGPQGEYVQLPGKKWQRSKTASVHALPWDKLLSGITNSQVSAGSGVASWHVIAHPPAQLASSLALTSTPTFTVTVLQISLDLDSQYRVVRMQAVATGTDGGERATVTETVSASGYDTQKPVPDQPSAGSA